MRTQPFATSMPASELWRPPDRLALSEAGWLGAAGGIALHAVLSFFAAWVAGLERVLVVFAPAERLASALARGAPPFVRWVVLLCVLAASGALVAVGLAAGWREVRGAGGRGVPTAA